MSLTLVVLLLPLVGFAIGLLVVTIGGGGGLLYVGILTAFFHIPGPVAAATSLATIIPTTAVGSFSHWRAGNIRLKLGASMLSGGIVGAVVGSFVSTLLPPLLYARMFGLFLLLMGAQMFFARRKRRKKDGAENKSIPDADASQRASHRHWLAASAYGLLGGLLSGLIGISGTPPIVAGLVILGCSSLEVVGTSVFVLLGIALIGFFTHLGLGTVDWGLVLALAIGTMLGALCGPLVLKRVNKAVIEAIYGPFFLVLIVGMAIVLLIRGTS